MRILYIGGTGEISQACVRRGAEIGQDLTVFNRGRRNEAIARGVATIVGDLNNEIEYRALGDAGFDVVCQFLAFDEDRVQRDLEVFGGKVKQYVFISSASAYQKPPASYRITEQTPLVNPFWEYSRKKAAMERVLLDAHAAGSMPVTIVRPSHTYRTRFPTSLPGAGDAIAWRMRQGKPVPVHGDGTSLWTITHSDDFAVPFGNLLGNERALGEAFHITHDHSWTWNQIHQAIADALGVEARIVHVTTDRLVARKPEWEGPLWGDKSNSVSFDNAKVKSVAGDFACRIDPWEGMRRVAQEHYNQRAARYEPDGAYHDLLDRICSDAGS